jgi:hypothetical protein
LPELITTTVRPEDVTLPPVNRHKQNPFLSLLTPKEEITESPFEKLQAQPAGNDPLLRSQLSPQPDDASGQDPLLRQLSGQSSEKGAGSNLLAPRGRQDPLLRQLSPHASKDGAGLSTPPDRQDPLLRQLNSHATEDGAGDGLSVPYVRQDPLLRQLSQHATEEGAGSGLNVPRDRQDPLLRGLTPGHHDHLDIDLPQVTTRKINKDEDNESSSLSPFDKAGGRKKDPLLNARPLAGADTDPTGLEPPPDLAAIFGTTESSRGTAEKLRISPEPGENYL